MFKKGVAPLVCSRLILRPSNPLQTCAKRKWFMNALAQLRWGSIGPCVESSHLANFTIVLRVSVEFMVTTAGPPLNMCQAAYCSL